MKRILLIIKEEPNDKSGGYSFVFLEPLAKLFFIQKEKKQNRNERIWLTTSTHVSKKTAHYDHLKKSRISYSRFQHQNFTFSPKKL